MATQEDGDKGKASGSTVAARLAALEGVIKQMPPSVPVDYHHECVPKGLLKYALVDRGHKSGRWKWRLYGTR